MNLHIKLAVVNLKGCTPIEGDRADDGHAIAQRRSISGP
jgi:hypothetical protein